MGHSIHPILGQHIDWQAYGELRPVPLDVKPAFESDNTVGFLAVNARAVLWSVALVIKKEG